MVRRHGQPPLGFLADLAVLGPGAIIAHAIFLDHHPWLAWRGGRDLALSAKSGASMARAPAAVPAPVVSPLPERVRGYYVATINCRTINGRPQAAPGQT